jgi:uncharacterized membrane protein YgdD (TMEM256/DUF423 family)
MIAGILGAVGVALGAFGAHLLPGYLARQAVEAAQTQRRLDTFDTAVLYHMLHVLPILALGLSVPRSLPRVHALGVLAWIVGIVLFSGFLYAYSITGIRPLAMAVPLGGLAFILGWIAVALGAGAR